MEDLWNNPVEKPYAVFEGQNTREMPKLIKEGRAPISPQHLYYRKLEVLNEYHGALKMKDEKAAELWKARMHEYWDKGIDTGFGIAVHPDKGYKFVPDSQFLREIDPKTELLNGLAVMPDGMYESLDVQPYTLADVEKYGNRMQQLNEALENPFLKELVPNKVTRELAIINVFAQGKERFGYDKMMGNYFLEPQNQPVSGLWRFGWLVDWAYASGRSHFSGNCGRLVGVRDVAEGDAQKLEHILKAA